MKKGVGKVEPKKLPIKVPKWRSYALETLTRLRDDVKGTAPPEFVKQLSVCITTAKKG